MNQWDREEEDLGRQLDEGFITQKEYNEAMRELQRDYRIAADEAAWEEPCSHPGCLSHISHPCEGCGRIRGANKERAEGGKMTNRVCSCDECHPELPEHYGKPEDSPKPITEMKCSICNEKEANPGRSRGNEL